MKHRLLVFLSAFISTMIIYAQQPQRCGQEDHMSKYKSLQPGLLEDIERTLAPGMAEHRFSANRFLTGNTIYIPVHVIIVHKPADSIGFGSNLSEARILSQLAALNEDYARMNADTINTPSEFSVGNPSVQFCLARIDPDGNPTNGITRYPSTANFDEEEFTIKAETGWPRADYMNVWVAEIEDLGYAYIPSLNALPNSTLDGVVVNTIAFGGPGTGTQEPYDLGRTATHEVGHYLGLQHIWRGSGCTNDDGFSDTPVQDDENFGCPSHPSPSCSNTGDMFMNYMDYTDDACMNAFSAMQASHMRNILLGIRSSLMLSGELQCNTATLSVNIDSIGQPACFGETGGYLGATALGGIGPYVYTLRTESNSSGQFNSIPGGDYLLTVKDAIGDSVAVMITIPQPLPIAVDSIDLIQPACFGETGSATFYASGGTPFNNQTYILSIEDSFYPQLIADSLNAGTYTAVISDSLGCAAYYDFTLMEGNLINIDLITISGIRCYGDSTGAIFISASGGFGDLTTEVNGNPVNGAVVSDLTAGKYIFTATDALGCSAADSINLMQPTQLQADATATDIACFGDKTGTILFTANGGRPPYFYSADGQNFSINPLITGLGANSYNVVVLDSDQCRWQDTLMVNGPEELLINNIDISYDEETEKYTAVIHVAGGNPPYTIYIDSISNVLEDSIFIAENAGNFTVFVEDQSGCEVSKPILFSSVADTELNYFTVGPNPVNDYLTIHYSGHDNEEADLTIYDISGKLIWQQDKILFTKEKNTHNFFVKNIPDSIFIFKIVMKFKSKHILMLKE